MNDPEVKGKFINIKTIASSYSFCKPYDVMPEDSNSDTWLY
jgi:hypothetical protein